MKKAYSILVISEFSEEAVVYRTVLESSGYHVYFVNNYKRAKKAFSDPNLVLVIALNMKASIKIEEAAHNQIPVWSLQTQSEKCIQNCIISSKELLTKVDSYINSLVNV